MLRRWIFAAGAIAATSAAALELQTGSEEDRARFEVEYAAIQAKTYRDKVLACAEPEWADESFIKACIDSAINDCTFALKAGKPVPCVNGYDLDAERL